MPLKPAPLLASVLAFLCLLPSLTLADKGDVPHHHPEPAHAADTLTSAAEPDYHPYTFSSPMGHAEGFAIDILRTAADASGYHITFTIGSRANIHSGLQNHKFDVLPFVIHTPEHEKTFELCTPYITTHGCAFIRKNDLRSYSCLNCLSTKKVIVVQGSVAHDFLTRHNLAPSHTTDTLPDAFRLLDSGKGHCVLTDEASGRETLALLGIRTIKAFSTPIKEMEQQWSFAVPKGHTQLRDKLNNGLQTIRDNGLFQLFHKKWFAPTLPPPGSLSPTQWLILTFSLSLIAILTLALAWLWQTALRRRIDVISAQLHTANERYLLALQGNRDGIWDWNINTGSITVSDRFEEMLGYRPGERPFNFKVWEHSIHPDDRENTLKIAQDYLDNLNPIYENEFRLRHKDGSYRWILARGAALRDAKGKPYRMAGSHTDITEKKLSDQILRENEARFRAFTLAQPDLLLSLDKNGVLLDISCPDPDLRIAPREEILNKNGPEIGIPHDVHQRFLAAIERAITHQQTQTFEYEHTLPSGLRCFEARIAPISNNETLAICRDITEQRQSQQALVEAKLQAESGNRAKSEFLATMSHELRTPLNGIIAPAELLLEKSLAPDQLRLVQIMHRGANMLLTIINDILDYTKIESGKMALQHQPVPLEPLLADVTSVFLTKADAKNLQLRTLIEPGSPEAVMTDPTRLRQIIANLLSNAIKFTEHGSITLRVHPAPLRDAQERPLLTFQVADTGPGIPEAIHESLFEPFTQADSTSSRKHGGTGLGLAIVKKLTDLLEGKIHLHSEPGKGSTFSITIPAPEAPQYKLASASSAAKPSGSTSGTQDTLAAAHPLSLLLVEDDATSREVMELLLDRFGYRAEVAHTGHHALELIDTLTFDTILLDIQMPEINGFDILKKLRADSRQNDTYVIACTAHALVQDREKILAAGANDFLSKPIEAEPLRLALIEASRHHS